MDPLRPSGKPDSSLHYTGNSVAAKDILVKHKASRNAP